MKLNLETEGNYLERAKASIEQSLASYCGEKRYWNVPLNRKLQAYTREDILLLKSTLEKINENVFQIATFGLVSKGKSSVINAFLGENILPRGPIHGVTQKPQSLRWNPYGSKMQIEFVDTPGLDEIGGDSRTDMANLAAHQADLILFVVSGDITRTEYKVICKLLENRKPVLLVFNKIDLYPEVDQNTIWEKLKDLACQRKIPISPEDIVCISAEPNPVLVHIECPDGTIKEEIEVPAPQIDALKLKILQILNQDGQTLLALNSLHRARESELNIARKTLQIQKAQAESLIWRYARYKSLVVAMVPLVLIDVLAGILADLALIKALASLYGLPMTSHKMALIWRGLSVSLGSLSLSELFSLGLGKMMLQSGGVSEYVGSALLQAGTASYGTYRIGRSAQEYLETGSTWTTAGSSKIIEEIMSQATPQSLLARFIN